MNHYKRHSVALHTFLVSICFLHSACQLKPSAYDHCIFDERAGWIEFDISSDRRAALLALPYEDATVDQSMSFNGRAVREAWFKNQEGDLQMCRYENIADQCDSDAYLLLFNNNQGKYQPETIETVLCLVHYRRR